MSTISADTKDIKTITQDKDSFIISFLKGMFPRRVRKIYQMQLISFRYCVIFWLLVVLICRENTLPQEIQCFTSECLIWQRKYKKDYQLSYLCYGIMASCCQRDPKLKSQSKTEANISTFTIRNIYKVGKLCYTDFIHFI